MFTGTCIRQLAILVTGAVLVLRTNALAAQSFDFAHDPRPVIQLDGLWRFHSGDSPAVNGAPAWADPAFNDSSWTTLRSDHPWSDQGYPDLGGFAWYRFKVIIPAGQEPTSLLLAPMLTSYRVFIDGRAAGGLGKMPSAVPSILIRFAEYPLTATVSPVQRTLQVSIRVWHSPMWAAYVGGGPMYGGSLAGDPALLGVEMRHRETSRNIHYVDEYSWSIIAGLIGLAILALFFIRPAEREYLWFAIMLLAQAADNALFVANQAFSWPQVPVNDLADGILTALTAVSLLCFFSLILDVPLRKSGRIAIVLATFSPFPTVFYWPGWASPATSASIQIVCLLPASFWTLFALGRRAWGGNLDARLLLLPAGLDIGYYFADNVATVLGQLGLFRNPRVLEVALPLPPFSVQIGTLFHLVFLLALLVFLIRRFAFALKREQRLQGEFEAARLVQQVLVPSKIPAIPGFQLESRYIPAGEVGGDFFQIISTSNGGALLVIGDVSGKGMPAAMTVALLVGTLRTLAHYSQSPGEILAAMNQRMLGRSSGGFTTCLILRVDIDGTLTAANAGHIAPLINGIECMIENGLPLGLDSNASYPEITFKIPRGGQLTLLTDGVVEARAPSGELFGFDRAATISTRPAESIASAAQAFGQEDDITVVTLTLTVASSFA